MRPKYADERTEDSNVGRARAGITAVPQSERNCFVESAACMVTKHECWNPDDRIPDVEAHQHGSPYPNCWRGIL